MKREYPLKRPIDVVVAAAALLGLAPVLGGAAFAIRVRMGSPVLFRQQRPGRDGEVFELLKFRTMIDATNADGSVLSDAERLTALGRFLRRTSIDELPTLINVLRGEMSLVGPRPLLVRYLDRYTQEQLRRHDVRPGVTGWAQINGRNAISWAEKFELDTWYVDHQSLDLDLKILAATVKRVLGQADISHDGEATMSEFWGTATPEV